MSKTKFCYLLVILFALNGCAGMYNMDKGSIPSSANLGNQRIFKWGLDRLERSEYVYEKTFKYTYKEVFFASLTVVRDWGANVFIKDYDKGEIFIRPELQSNYMGPAASWAMPGEMCGLYFQKINDEETKVTLKAVRTKTYSVASAEDVFIEIEKEVQFRKKVN